jgi:hypothetical protein
MKIILVFFLFIMAQVSFANRMLEYVELVNEAELLICAHKMQDALTHYNKAFESEQPAFGKDLYNAWQLAFICNDQSAFKKISKVLIRNGAFMKGKVYESILRPLGETVKVKKYSRLWDQVRKTTKVEINMGYRKHIQQLQDEDQQVRKYFVEKFGGDYNKGGRDSLNVFDSLNVLKLAGLIETHGFPTEQTIGYANYFPANEPLYEIILLHDRSWTNRKTLDSLLYAKVITGEFPQQTYAMLKNQSLDNTGYRDSIATYQRVPGTKYAMHRMDLVDGELYITRLSEADTTRYVVNRQDIYLDSVKEMCIKGAFQNKNKNFIFLFPGVILDFPGLPPEIIDNIKNKWSYKKGETDGFNTIGKQRCKYGLHH